MKHTLKTTLVLLLAGVINAFGQTHEAAITALETAEGVKYAIGNTTVTPSQAAIALKDQILQENAVSDKEAVFVMFVLKCLGAFEGEQRTAMLTTLAAKGSVRAQALLKLKNGTFDGWTAQMVKILPDGACIMALRPSAPPEFEALVFNTLRETPWPIPNWIKFFKEYRDSLPKEQQIAVTAELKAVLLAVPIRSDAANAFLASLSADLVALQLDQ